MVAPLILGWVVPALAGEYDVVVQLAQLHQLGETSLSDEDLAAVSGRGTQRASSQAEADRVIIWDEGPANSISFNHSLTGHGGTQSSTVTINGR
jgi:hypothetical protein